MFSRIGRPIRIAFVNSSRIGGIAQQVDCINRLRERGDIPRNALVLGVMESQVCNLRLGAILRRYIVLSNGVLVRLIANRMSASTIARRSSLIVRAGYQRMYQLAKEVPSTVSFTPDELAECESKKSAMGLLSDDWFVCMHARDGAYLNSVLGGNDWSYHDFRDFDFDSFMAAAKFIRELGGIPIRIGHVVNRPLSDESRRVCLDYSSQFRDELMDLYLPSANRFFLGNSSGMHAVATLFNCPVAFTNFIPLNLLPVAATDLVIPKLVWCKKKSRLLTFQEMAEIGIMGTLSIHSDSVTVAGLGESTFYRERNLEPVENEPEDIVNLCREMLENLSGKQPDARLTAMQIEFKDQYFSNVAERHDVGNISGYFLERHRHLWDDNCHSETGA